MKFPLIVVLWGYLVTAVCHAGEINMLSEAEQFKVLASKPDRVELLRFLRDFEHSPHNSKVLSLLEPLLYQQALLSYSKAACNLYLNKFPATSVNGMRVSAVLNSLNSTAMSVETVTVVRAPATNLTRMAQDQASLNHLVDLGILGY